METARGLGGGPRFRIESDGSSCNLGDAQCNLVCGGHQGIVREISVAGGRMHVVVAQQLSDHRKTFVDKQTTAGVRMARDMNSVFY